MREDEVGTERSVDAINWELKISENSVPTPPMVTSCCNETNLVTVP